MYVSVFLIRFELEQLRDKMTVVTQQSVAASLSAWHDKMEQSVRNVERQVLYFNPMVHVFCTILHTLSRTLCAIFLP